MPQPMESRLSENHRRVVSVLMQQAEMVCDEVERWLSRPSGLLNRTRGEFPPTAQNQLRELLQRARREISRSAAALNLSSAVVVRRQAVLSLLTKILSDIEDVHSPGLRAYGNISPELEQQVDAHLARLHAIFEQMAELCVRS
ncbi:MAG: hypothetical protein K6U09_10325 [Acidobacteriia bacterium]|jgi:hypothetical protein|nr:hypothetical protein [Terriglobia bacterium]